MFYEKVLHIFHSIKLPFDVQAAEKILHVIYCTPISKKNFKKLIYVWPHFFQFVEKIALTKNSAAAYIRACPGAGGCAAPALPLIVVYAIKPHE